MKALSISAGAVLSCCMGTCLAAGMAAGPGPGPAPVPRAQPQVVASGYLARTERGQLAQQIVRRWSGYVNEIYGTAPATWAKAMADTFAQADLANLREAAKRQTFEAMNSTLGGRALTDRQAVTALARSDGSRAAVKSIGSALGDLTYTPTQPCRIVDTRLAVGALSPNITRNFISSGSSFEVQGGSSTNCAIPADPSALALNVTVLGATGGPGFIRVYPYGVGSDAVSVNYTAGQRISNEVIVKMTRGQPFDFSAISGFGTHIVVDVAGYFMAPAATGLDCTTTVAQQTITAGSTFNFTMPECPANYVMTGANCNGSDYTNINWVVSGLYTLSGTQGAYCSGTNTGAASKIIYGTRMCCRVPGR